jgi:hypothetical protein
MFARFRWFFLAWLAIAAVSVAMVVPTGIVLADEDDDINYGTFYVITNFDITSVEIDGEQYPAAWIYGENGGVRLYPDHRYHIVISAGPDHRRTLDLTLRPGETRVLVVDIENIGAAPAVATASVTTAREEEGEEEGSEEIGHLGVSSSPRGTVFVDGSSTGQRTPARRIALEPGRHEVTVFYDDEDQMSEVKHVLIRAGVNTNVFFRLRRTQPAEE